MSSVLLAFDVVGLACNEGILEKTFENIKDIRKHVFIACHSLISTAVVMFQHKSDLGYALAGQENPTKDSCWTKNKRGKTFTIIFVLGFCIALSSGWRAGAPHFKLMVRRLYLRLVYKKFIAEQQRALALCITHDNRLQLSDAHVQSEAHFRALLKFLTSEKCRCVVLFSLRKVPLHTFDRASKLGLVLRRLSAGSLEAVLIRNAGLGHDRLALSEFLEALSGYHNLELNLSSPVCQSIVAGAGKMLSLMAPLKLRSLSLGHNSLGSAPHHLDTLMRFASRATLLQTLDLSMNAFGPISCAMIRSGLSSHQKLIV